MKFHNSDKGLSLLYINDNILIYSIIYMKIGFIVGKNNEICHNKELKKKTPKKYLVDCYDNGWKKNTLQIDVAIAMTIKTRFTGITIDIILPNEISLARLKKNDINYVMVYDYVSTLIQEPYVKKFVDNPQKLLDLSINTHSQFTLRPDQKIFYDFMGQLNSNRFELSKQILEKIK